MTRKTLKIYDNLKNLVFDDSTLQTSIWDFIHPNLTPKYPQKGVKLIYSKPHIGIERGQSDPIRGERYGNKVGKCKGSRRKENQYRWENLRLERLCRLYRKGGYHRGEQKQEIKNTLQCGLWGAGNTPKTRRLDNMVSNPKKDMEKEPKKVFGRKGKCKWCGSDKVVKNGKKDGKQLWKCKECKHQFFDNGKFPRMRNKKKVMAIALELYFDGLSFPKVAKNLKKIFGVEVDQRTIQRWIEKYVPQVEKYLTNFKPQLSGKWHVDETCLKIGGQNWWHWDGIDADTRFLIAQHLSPVRGKLDGVAFFEKTKYAPRPHEIVTDGCYTYNCAINKTYYSHYKDRRVKRTQIGHVSENILIERWHGGLKDRTKPMRGLKSCDTKIPSGYAIHYNYLTEHGKFGKTPAQMANINLPFEDGWGDLIGWSITHQNLQEMN